MSEPVAAVVEQAPDFGKMESVAEFRAARGKLDAPAEVEAPAAEAVAGQPEAKPEAAPVEELAEQPEAEADKADKAARKGSLQSRIDELVREKHQTAAEKAASDARIAALEAQIAALGGKSAPKQSDAPAEYDGTDQRDLEPDVNTYEDYQKYVKDVAAWEARKIVRVERARYEQAQQAQAVQAADARSYQAGKAEYADFDETIGEFVKAGGRFAAHVAEEIRSNPIGHKIAYALAKDPALAAKLNTAPSAPVFWREIGKLETALQAAPKVEAKPAVKVSSAPAPVPAIARAETPAGTPDPANMSSIAAWRQHRKQYE
jgi:hypothetical protein